MSPSLQWKSIKDVDDFERIIEGSRNKPVLLFKHRPTSPESVQVKKDLEADWSISPEILDLFLVDVMQQKDVAAQATEAAGVSDEFPQVFLFADGVTMYDESHEMINVKKIKIALKIINRTFRWLDTRV